MRRVFKRESYTERAARRRSITEEEKKTKASRVNARRKSRIDGDLSANLMGNDHLQMQQMQPKSFFSHDDEQVSESAASAVAETFESVGYAWDFVIVMPVTPPENFEEPFLEPSEVPIIHPISCARWLLCFSVDRPTPP